jgi:hypothetical protein
VGISIGWWYTALVATAIGVGLAVWARDLAMIPVVAVFVLFVPLDVLWRSLHEVVEARVEHGPPAGLHLRTRWSTRQVAVTQIRSVRLYTGPVRSLEDSRDTDLGCALIRLRSGRRYAAPRRPGDLFDEVLAELRAVAPALDVTASSFGSLRRTRL